MLDKHIRGGGGLVRAGVWKTEDKSLADSNIHIRGSGLGRAVVSLPDCLKRWNSPVVSIQPLTLYCKNFGSYHVILKLFQILNLLAGGAICQNFRFLKYFEEEHFYSLFRVGTIESQTYKRVKRCPYAKFFAPNFNKFHIIVSRLLLIKILSELVLCFTMIHQINLDKKRR